MLEWDEDKRRVNLQKHGIDFTIVEDFDWSHAVFLPDQRKDYGEQRIQAFGLINGRLYGVLFTRRGEHIRIIGVRKANARERKKYV